uniref:Uncharacterized protein n=1 Tax=Caenorhabditis japonica TaxID=281687 RepID=A0A8R1E483_CAEJA
MRESKNSQAPKVRYEQFKVEKIEELQNVYRKELQDQNSHIEKLRQDRLDLIKENDHLLEKIANFDTEIDDLRRKEKAKEVELRVKFDKKLKEILMDTEKKVSPRLENFQQTLEHLYEEIRRKEESILEKSKEFSAKISEKNTEIERLKTTNNDFQCKVQELEAQISSLNLQLHRNTAENELKLELDGLKLRNEILFGERMELEVKMRQEQRESARILSDFEEKFSVKISEFEKLCEQKDEHIQELNTQLEKCEKLREELENSERNRQIEDEHRERLELEVKDLYGKLQKAGEERQTSENSLKMERDRLEVNLVTLKKQLESTPESPQNVEKLRKELRESERKRVSEKEKHQNIIQEFTSALKIIEKRQRVTQEKIREKMATSLL